MRIAIIGQAAFGQSVLDALVERGESVVAAFCPPDREGRPLDPLKEAASKHDIPVYQFDRMRDRDAIAAFKNVQAELCLMAFVTDIVPEAILEAPTRGTIQYHPSLLPKHRGPSSINWPIIQGAVKTGLTIFWPDRGLDTGPSLLQREVEIGPDDTVGSLYFDRLFPIGVDAMLEAVDMVRNGSAPKLAQDESQATYEGWCQSQDVVIDWSSPVGDIYNLIRGSDPSPGANTTFNGKSIALYRAVMHNGESGGDAPGLVTDVSKEGFRIAARGGSLFIPRVQPGGSAKVMASEWIATVGLKAGDRFDS